MAPTLVDAGLDNLTIASPGITRIFMNFTNNTMNDTIIVTLVGRYATQQGVEIMAAGIVPAQIAPCGINSACLPLNTPTNLTVWLTSLASYNAVAPNVSPLNTTVYSLALYKTITITDTGNSTQGYFGLKVPQKIYIIGTQNQNISVPISRLRCGDANPNNAMLGVMMTGPSVYCGTSWMGPISCASLPSNFIFEFKQECSISVGTTYVFTTLLFTPEDYAIYRNGRNSGYFYVDDQWPGYVEEFTFQASLPRVSVGLTPGQPATAEVGGLKVKAPPLIPPGLSGSLSLEVNPKGKGSKGPIAAVDVTLDNGTDFKVANLSQPLEVTIPLDTPASPCQETVCHFWDVQYSNWSTDGCQTLPAGNGAFTCSCNHATDFSLLLLDSQSGCSAEINPTLEPFFLYATLYIILGIVALYAAIRIIAVRPGKHLDMTFEHLGLVVVCILRAFLSFYQTGVSGPVTMLELSAISAVPRLLEFALFSFIVSQWAALLHFSMASNPFKKARPFVIGVNVFAAVIIIYIFIAFGVSPSFEAAAVGESLLTVNSLLLSGGFMVYATWLHKQFSKVRIAGTSTAAKPSCWPTMRIVLLGWLLAVFFVLQAIFSLLSLFALPQGGGSSDLVQVQLNVDVYNGLYRMFNFFTLSCIIGLYFEGIRKLIAKHDMSRVSTDQSRPSSGSTRSLSPSSYGTSAPGKPSNSGLQSSESGLKPSESAYGQGIKPSESAYGHGMPSRGSTPANE